MTTELLILVLSVLLGLLQLVAATMAKREQDGLEYAVGARDKAQTYTGAAARLDRAFNNFKETFVFFATAILVAHATGKDGRVTEAGACLYFVCRVIYVPLYAWGVPYGRTLVWGMSMAGLCVVVLACLIPPQV